MLLKNHTLLYVEDNLEMQQYMQNLLKDEFKEFYLASDGIEGLKIYETKKPDIILSDINMPNMDGIEMSTIIKNNDDTQYIILLTALNEIDILKQAIDIGIDAFINKPIEDIDILFNKLESMAKKIQNAKDAKEFVKITKEQEKTEVIFDLLNELAHQWKQPLNIISTISSGYIYKKQNGMQSDDDDIEMADLVEKTTYKLSNIIDKIAQLNTKSTTIDELQNLIQVSNPLYKDEK